MDVFCRGCQRQVVFLPEASSTLEGSLARVLQKRRRSCQAQLFAVLQSLANSLEVLNKDKFRHEGNKIYAVKTNCGVRGYGWFQQMSQGGDAFVVSHFILKKTRKLDPRDLQRAKEARANFGENYAKP